MLFAICLSADCVIFSTVSRANALEREDITSLHACSTATTVETLDARARHDDTAPPRQDGKPVHVDLALYVEQLTNISEVSHTFRVEAFLEMIWCDPRLAISAGQEHNAVRGDHKDHSEHRAGDRRIYLEEAARAKLHKIWWPDLIFVNAASRPDRLQEELIVFADGTVIYEERFDVEIAARLDVRKFPFDSQKLPIEIESFAWPSGEVVLHKESDKIGFADDFNMPSWKLTGFSADIHKVREIRDRDTFSEFVMVIGAERVSTPFLFRLILPLVLIVVASWSVFWLKPISNDRFMVTFTTILTVVAFNFIVTARLPNVPDVTYVEALFGVSFIFLLLVVAENTIVSWQAERGSTEMAERTDNRAKLLFPILYFSGIGLVTWTYGII